VTLSEFLPHPDYQPLQPTVKEATTLLRNIDDIRGKLALDSLRITEIEAQSHYVKNIIQPYYPRSAFNIHERQVDGRTAELLQTLRAELEVVRTFLELQLEGDDRGVPERNLPEDPNKISRERQTITTRDDDRAGASVGASSPLADYGELSTIVRPETTAALILGASKWPHMPGLPSVASIEHSASALMDFLGDESGFGMPPENIICLFNSELPPSAQLRQADTFVESMRRPEGAAAPNPIRDIIIYYAGQGAYDTDGGFYLLVNESRQDQITLTSIGATLFGEWLRRAAQGSRVYVIVDCSFAAGLQQGLARQWPQGLALLSAVGANAAAVAPAAERYTLFTGSLLEILHNGSERFPPLLSLSDIHQLVLQRIQEKYTDSALPELLSIGNVGYAPLFRNQAIPARQRRAQDARLVDERREADATRQTEEQRKAEGATQQADGIRKAEEAARQKGRSEQAVDEQRRAKAAARSIEEQRSAEEATRKAEEDRKAAEAEEIVPRSDGVDKFDQLVSWLRRRLRLLAFMRVKADGKGEVVDLPPYESEVRVAIAPIRAVEQFLRKNWKWIAGGIMIPLAVWIGISIVLHERIQSWLHPTSSQYQVRPSAEGETPQSDADPVHKIRMTADQGNADAQYSLGWRYEDGRNGLTKSDTDAIRYYRLAADQGNADAQYSLGRMYEDGRGGLTKSDTDAIRYYQLAADHGNANAQYSLGRMYEDPPVSDKLPLG
jgi:hypothetical protein